MDETSSPPVSTPLIAATRELDAAKAVLNAKKKELEQTLHAMNEATEAYLRAVKAFNAACQIK